jgi:hypothetical protein
MIIASATPDPLAPDAGSTDTIQLESTTPKPVSTELASGDQPVQSTAWDYYLLNDEEAISIELVCDMDRSTFRIDAWQAGLNR